MNIRFFKKLEISGVFVIFGIAVLLHFSYQLTGGSVFSILFGAVNESVWENTKIFLVAYSIWAVVELLVSNVHFKSFVVSKVIGVYFLGIFIIVTHYLVKAFTGNAVLWIDIVMGLLGIVFAQIISFFLTIKNEEVKHYFYPSLFFLAMFFICIFSFTVFPPHFALFKDEQTGFYGIIPKNMFH